MKRAYDSIGKTAVRPKQFIFQGRTDKEGKLYITNSTKPFSYNDNYEIGLKSVAFVNDDVRKSESSSIYRRDSLSGNLSLTPNLFITGKKLADAFNEKVGADNFYLKPNSSGLYYLLSKYQDKSTVAISMSPALSYLFGWSTKDGERMPKLTSILFGNDLQSGYPFNIESTTHGKLTFFRLQNSREKWPLSFNTNTDVWNLIRVLFKLFKSIAT